MGGSSDSGNAFVRCARGHRHWGRFGAAGLLITDGDRVVLHRRAGWTHEGGTWALPGGARDRHEDVTTAALREAAEETTLDPAEVTPFGCWIDDHGGWSYTTVLAHADSALALEPASAETAGVGWWPVAAVETLPLHAGFAASWPHLRTMLAPPATHRPTSA